MEISSHSWLKKLANWDPCKTKPMSHFHVDLLRHRQFQFVSRQYFISENGLTWSKERPTFLNPLSANPTKLSNMFDHFVGWCLKG